MSKSKSTSKKGTCRRKTDNLFSIRKTGKVSVVGSLPFLF